MYELEVILNEQEIRKLEYLVRNRITHCERRLAKNGNDARSQAAAISLLEEIQDKLERARLRV